jgi:hypothetical protein
MTVRNLIVNKTFLDTRGLSIHIQCFCLSRKLHSSISEKTFQQCKSFDSIDDLRSFADWPNNEFHERGLCSCGGHQYSENTNSIIDRIDAVVIGLPVLSPIFTD